MKLRVYLCAPQAEAARVIDFAAELRSLPHVDVVSTWAWRAMLQPQGLFDPPERPERLRILQQNLDELSQANLVIGLTGKGVPRATLCELTWAIANGVQVIWVQRPDGAGGCIFDAHPLVTLVHSREEALAAVRKFLEMP